MGFYLWLFLPSPQGFPFVESKIFFSVDLTTYYSSFYMLILLSPGLWSVILLTTLFYLL